MLLPVSQVAILVNALKLTWLDKVYLNEIPNEDLDNTTSTVMLLQETDSSPAYLANNTFKGLAMGVEIQIFYKVNLADDFNPLEAEIALMKSLKAAGWLIVSSQHHTTDPDTNQVTKTIYVAKNEMI
ncbi:phage tail protein [Lactiplantibacillus plantarum]|nr:phage tail protein [Lactiplantibacillus plantarum]MCG0598514.1 phage tail protein [Lactiplantibacillus plantarum]MCG0602262.1 phage tail protein [Lactiplantibacillus plantarum]MCG0605194.1 phage tail protein [Lactiplantibacillus plantarum]MCG0742727.1 phage tail protein [Lactiplantibacillus plantarum]